MSPWTNHSKNLGKGCARAAKFATPPSEEDLITIFNRFDTSGDGLLSREEVKSAYNHLGKSFAGLRTWWTLLVGDENSDGYIDQKEFIKLVKKNYLT